MAVPKWQDRWVLCEGAARSVGERVNQYPPNGLEWVAGCDWAATGFESTALWLGTKYGPESGLQGLEQ